MEEADNTIMPNSVELAFLYSDNLICCVPVFLMVLLIREQGKTPENNKFLNELDIVPGRIAENRATQSPYLDFLRQTIFWNSLSPYLSCPPYLKDKLKEMWSCHNLPDKAYSIQFQSVRMPDTIYRYMRFHPDRVRELLADGKLFMPCPAMLNDPFDCSLDEPTRLTFIECAIGSFSTVPNDILMFSHYADNHRGLCIGFNTRKLIHSLTANNKPLSASIRPVRYFTEMPPLKLVTQPALCATCKHDIWSYEHEYRVFMENGFSLASSASFAFDREAISEVICGCEATNDTVAECKILTNDLSSCKQKKALQMPNQFGVQLHTIHKM